MLALLQASLRLNVVWISCPSFVLSSFLGAKIELIFDTSKKRGKNLIIIRILSLLIRHLIRVIRQKYANELDSLDRRGYSAKIIRKATFFLIILHLENRKVEAKLPNHLIPVSTQLYYMSRDLMQGKRIYDRMKNQSRQQLALMNKCRMRKTGGNGVASQPFYVQFLNC